MWLRRFIELHTASPEAVQKEEEKNKRHGPPLYQTRSAHTPRNSREDEHGCREGFGKASQPKYTVQTKEGGHRRHFSL